MQDESLNNLCKTVYRKHREAIDLIVEYGSSSQVIDTSESSIRDLIECEFLVRTGQRVFFLPRPMGNAQPELPLSGWQILPRRVPVVCWVYYHTKQGTLRVAMEVGPLEDADLRMRLLKSIKKAGFTFWEKEAFKKGAKHTRILSIPQKLKTDAEGEPIDDPDHITDVTKSLWKKLWAEGEKIVGVLEAFDWKG